MILDILRAWKDPEYRKSLTPEQLALVPENPAGNAELSDDDLDKVSGGYANSVGTCGNSCVCSIVCKNLPKPKV